jgi:hypothetical protein
MGNPLRRELRHLAQSDDGVATPRKVETAG